LKGGGPIDYSSAKPGQQGDEQAHAHTLPSGKVTVVVDTPAGPQFPYYEELTGKDKEFADRAVRLGSVQQAIESDPSFSQSRVDPTAQSRQSGLNVNALQTENTRALEDLKLQQEAAFRQQNGLNVQNQNYIVGLQNNAGWLAGQNNDLSNRAWENADTANRADQQALGSYTQALNNATQWDLANYNNLQGAYANTGILKAGGYGPNVVSQAQYAQADPAAIAAQNQALAQLQGAANGSLNQTSQAAKAYANAGDVFNQRYAADQLQSIAGGANDIHVGQADPEAYAAALDAMGKFKTLSNPEVTAQERFIYEQARLQQEQDDRSNRGAILSNLRQRGMSGSGSEIGDMALASQRTSQNRLLSDLGAQSNAISRAMTSLQGYGSMSSNLNAQGNQIAASNADRRTQAQAMASEAYATLRAQGFSEEYSRGQAADIMANANANRQLGAMEASGNLASTQRQQSFNEDFSRKSAADQMAQFNKEQSQISQRWQEQYAAGQQTDAWNRSVDMSNAADRVGRNYATDQGNLFTGTTTVNNNTATRNTNAINSVGQLNANTVRGWEGVANAGMQANGIQSQTAAQQLAAQTQLAGMGMQNNFNTTSLANEQQRFSAGQGASKIATDQARADAERANSFRFGLGGDRGLLGGNLIPGII
jgi:hypothetical protein